jgi:hypothetical protein
MNAGWKPPLEEPTTCPQQRHGCIMHQVSGVALPSDNIFEWFALENTTNGIHHCG